MEFNLGARSLASRLAFFTLCNGSDNVERLQERSRFRSQDNNRTSLNWRCDRAAMTT
ncbi:MAG: hypothetical protein AB1589_07620 [Cyanobacteriota bacterium]